MRTTLIALAIIAGLLAAPLGLDIARKAARPAATAVSIDKNAKETAIPTATSSLEENSDLKIQAVKKVLTLEDTNMVELRGPVTGSSVASAIKALRAASRRVSKSTPLYLVLDTPGGDIVAGTDLIDFCKGLPQKVHTITLFAASMGFQIAQNLDTRYIIPNGQLMSHRARVSGMDGQIKGEFETRYRMVRRTVDALDYIAYTRMGLDAKAYETLILHEYWVYGFDAVVAKAADEQVLVRCGESLDGTYLVVFDTLFGAVTVNFAKCPLIKEPDSIEMGRIANEHKNEVLDAIKMSLLDEQSFVNKFITTSRFSEFFR